MRMLLMRLRLYRSPLVVVAGLALVALVFGGLYLMGKAIVMGTIPLGNAQAPRATQAPIEIVGDVDPIARPIAAPLTTANRADAAGQEPDASLAAPLVAALNCARAQASLDPLTVDPALSEAAANLWRTLMLHPDTDPATLVGRGYPLVTILPLTLTSEGDGDAASGPCEIGDVDLAELDLSGVTYVGVAVFRDTYLDDGLDDSSAVVVAR